MVNFVDISAAPFLAWDVITQTIADCIATVVKPATGARIYPNWIYEIDVNTMLGRITAGMRATEGTSNGKIHCWTIGISAAAYEKNQSQDVPLVGGQNAAWTWILSLDVWGFWEYDGTYATQKQAQDEARIVSAALYRNANVMVAAIPALSDIRMLEYPAIQPTPMSDGSLLTVASGAMQARVNEALGI